MITCLLHPLLSLAGFMSSLSHTGGMALPLSVGGRQCLAEPGRRLAVENTVALRMTTGDVSPGNIRSEVWHGICYKVLYL